MKTAAKVFIEILNFILALIIIAMPFVIPTVADGDPLENTIGGASLVFFYGLWCGMWISFKFGSLSDKELERRKRLLHFFPLWSIPIFYTIYLAAYTFRR